MRIRTIKPEWLDDERISLASPNARVMSVALMLLADDEGRGRANPSMLAGRVFPGSVNPREDSVNALRELTELSFVLVYEVDGQSYYQIRNWKKHQRIERPSKSQLPAYDTSKCAESNDSPNPHRKLSEDSRGVGEASRTDRDLDRDQYQERESARAHVRDDLGQTVEIARPLASDDPVLAARTYLVAGFGRRYEQARGILWHGHQYQPDPTEVTRWLVDACRRHKVPFEAAADDILDRWFAEDWPRKQKFPWRTFCKQVPNYVPDLQVAQ